jgi:hypothetical protein
MRVPEKPRWWTEGGTWGWYDDPGRVGARLAQFLSIGSATG